MFQVWQSPMSLSPLSASVRSRESQYVFLVHEPVEVRRRHRPAEQISLQTIAGMLLQKRELADRLHSLGDDLELETMGERDHAERDLRVFRRGEIADERSVELERVDRELLEVAQA